MSMKQSLGLNLGQTLTMTPALQQAIRMLQLSTLDLKTEIQEALETNVMLEADDGTQEVDARTRQAEPPDTSGGDSADIPENLPVDADWNDIYASAPAPASSAPAEQAAAGQGQVAAMNTRRAESSDAAAGSFSAGSLAGSSGSSVLPDQCTLDSECASAECCCYVAMLPKACVDSALCTAGGGMCNP